MSTEERHEEMLNHYAELDRMRPEPAHVGSLFLPPGYLVEEQIYGTAVVDQANDRLVLLAPIGMSAMHIEESSWEDYANAVRDYVVRNRVSVKYVAGGPPPESGA